MSNVVETHTDIVPRLEAAAERVQKAHKAAAAVIFGQVTINETMTARYIAPPLRAKLYSVRFFVGFLGSAGAAPLVGILYDRTGSLSAAMLVLAAFAVITLLCALFFPDRREELEPELWQKLAPAE